VHLHAAEELAAATGDDRRLGWTLAYLANYFTLKGDQDEALAHGRRALALGTATGDDGLGVMGRFFLGIASLCGGSLADAVELFQQVVTTLAGARAAERFGEPGPPAQFARAFLGWSLAELGRFDEAVAVGEESLRMAQAIDEPFTLMHGYFGTGIPYLARGDVARAIPPLERCLALGRATDIRLWLGEIAAAALEGERAEADYQHAMVLASEIGLRPLMAHCHLGLGKLHRRTGKAQEAQEPLSIATTMYREMDMKYWLEQAQAEMGA
jgi:tetratricopeptide (TPR) repeat protein